MPIPYMGSKRKSAQQIYQTIKNFNPEANTIVYLFCGGFAISEKFYQNGFNVISNDKNKHVVALIDQTVNKGLDEKKCLEFITRQMFEDITKINQNKYPDWYVGYTQCIWSFGNTQTNYLFGKDVEPIKKAGHDLVIDKNPDSVLRLFPKFPQKYLDGILNQSSWQKRRIALLRVAQVLKGKQLEQLERLQQLQQLGRFERLQQLIIKNMSYNEVEIPKNAIIYCDPPYQGTAEYKEGGFNHKLFWDWARDISKTNKIYISEYSAPTDFKPLLSFEQKSTLQGGVQKHSNQPMERLFVPIGQEKFKNN